jgi:hypothetical protein
MILKAMLSLHCFWSGNRGPGGLAPPSRYSIAVAQT